MSPFAQDLQKRIPNMGFGQGTARDLHIENVRCWQFK